jgi:GT2 family glycosyltransferase
MNKVDLSVIIISYNSLRLLRACLSSLYSNTGVHSREIIVVDNASSDDTLGMVRREFPDVILIEESENLGYARAINKGVEQSCGEYCAVMNADTELNQDIFSHLMEFAKTAPDPGIIGCGLRFSDGSPQRSYFGFPTLYGRIAYFTGLNRLINAEILPKRTFDTQGLKAIEVDVVCGAFFMMNRETFNKIGGFEPDYFLYHEEADLCFRLQKAGFKNWVLPDITLIHHGKHDETTGNPDVFFHRNRSLLIYFYKNLSRLSLWSFLKLNAVYYTVRYAVTLIPVGNTIKRLETKNALATVLRYHKDFVKFLLSSSERKIP